MLKWKDLEFKTTYTCLAVNLNGHDYWVYSMYDDDAGTNVARIYDGEDREVCSCYEEYVEEVNFFNALQLEKIGEVEV